MTDHLNETNPASIDATTKTDTWELNALTAALGDLSLKISDSLSVGRGSDNDVILGSKSVSRNHALLSVLNAELYVKDLDSSNGTFVNDERIEANKSVLLQAEDKLGFAGFDFQVVAQAQGAMSEAHPVAEELEERVGSVQEDLEVTNANADVSANTDIDAATIDTSPIVEPNAAPVIETPVTKEPITVEDVVVEEKLRHEKASHQAPVISSEQDKTTTTELQEEADPDVLRAKQAATAQFSGTANLGQSRDLGTTGNNAMDQSINNPDHLGGSEQQPSGGWFIWVFIAILIIGIALWLFNMGGA